MQVSKKIALLPKIVNIKTIFTKIVNKISRQEVNDEIEIDSDSYKLILKLMQRFQVFS